jgi:type I restriction enzyme R subunit
MPFTEKKLVEDYILEKLEKKGWQFVPAEELERESLDEPLLIPNLIRALHKINKSARIGDEEIHKVLNELKLAPTGSEGSKKILNFYRFGVPVKFEKEKVVKYVQLFDFDTPESNEFIITRQAYFKGRDIIRTDIVLYVNGIPLANIECKDPTKISESWLNAFNQIKDYELIVPELYKYAQIGAAAESIARYFPIVPWQEDGNTYEWREESKDSIDSSIAMLSPETLLDIIQNYLFFRVEHGKATKVVARYMQFRAANKMVDRVLKNLNQEDYKDKGLTWHWQGSGKTLTMIFAAHKLYYHHHLGNPSVYFIVDRTELESQLYDEFTALDIFTPEIIDSISALKRVLKHDDYRSKRGVFIVLIHKFRPQELESLQRELETISKHKETVMTRKNIIALVDEGHRTQYGTLAAQMKAILKNAFFFAFTGTPISKRGRDTYLEFSYPPEESYLDSYSIVDSIVDGFTVQIVYQPRLEKEVHLRKADLEAFLRSEYEELPEEMRGAVEKKIKEKLDAIRVILENPGRIKVIAQDIAQHFKENIDGKFKAMVVAGSKLACERYKRALDSHLPQEYSEVVITTEGDRRSAIQQLVAESRERYGHLDSETIRKKVVENFKEEEYPKILIVTEMLLTGFDAPILQVMYLDKLLKEHRLLQAIARTNRPYKDLKEAGLIIDYVGILKEFKRAFEVYSSGDIERVLLDYESLREEFGNIIRKTIEIFQNIQRDYERETLLRAIEILTAEEGKEKEFIEKYKKLRKLFELLGPTEVRLKHLEDYKWLSAIYAYYLKVVIQRPVDEAVVKRFYEKTVRFIHKATEIEKLEKDLPAIAFDERYLEKLEEKVKSRKERAANILFTLNRFILVDRHRNPIYESLAEKVERLLEMWREKTRDYRRIYEESLKIIKEKEDLSERQRALGFSNLEYSILLELERCIKKGNDFVAIVRELSQSLQGHLFAGWMQQATAQKEVERDIRSFVRKLKGKFGLSFDEMNALHKKLADNVKNYGT